MRIHAGLQYAGKHGLRHAVRHVAHLKARLEQQQRPVSTDDPSDVSALRQSHRLRGRVSSAEEEEVSVVK
jgi:hypothetical protein